MQLTPRRLLLTFLVVFAGALALDVPRASAGKPIVDGISDQNMASWDGSFSSSPFASFFLTSKVIGGQIKIARYVVQWNAFTLGGDTRQKFHAWYDTVTNPKYGLAPDVAFTNYDGYTAPSRAEYEREMRSTLEQFPALRGGVIEAWNEPNHHAGASYVPAEAAAEFFNAAYRICHEGANRCAVIAGDFSDVDSDIKGYETKYEKALTVPTEDWGIHGYHATQYHTLEREEEFKIDLPAGKQIWITEVGVYVCAHGREGTEYRTSAQQRDDAEWLRDHLIPYLGATHVLYYEVMFGANQAVDCTKESDTELYDYNDEARPAANVILGGPGPAEVAFQAEGSSTQQLYTYSSSGISLTLFGWPLA